MDETMMELNEKPGESDEFDQTVMELDESDDRGDEK